ncbi:MAG TPA: RNA polymerase sigma-70 factor [Solirubrobacterales bacterium]|nr:RNA polymerase sigma-70 factor [Solirubrobacterales bacterium]
MSGLDSEIYEELRPRAFAIAYRMLGSVSEAEDVVQEALLRLHRVLEAGEEVASPGAYVATVATRLAIDELRSARARRETYVGEWLPEPVVTEERDPFGAADPARAAELADSLSLAFLVLLEKLTPEQRAVFLLHDVFDYPYADIAEIVDRSEAATRQLAVRARARVEEDRPAYDVTREQEEELAARFFGAVQEGDVEALQELLAADVELHGDGGGKAPALARPVHGRERAARTLAAWSRVAERVGIVMRQTRINGAPGAVTMTADGEVISVLALDIAEGQIQTIRGVVNPDKLGHLGPVADVKALFRGGAGYG